MELEKPVRIPDRMFFRIGEVSKIVSVKPYILRYWESEFSLLSPNKSRCQQRLYSKANIETALLIKHLLYDQKFSIQGARKRLAEMKRKGELGDQRKVKVAIDMAQYDALQELRCELRELIGLCDTNPT